MELIVALVMLTALLGAPIAASQWFMIVNLPCNKRSK